MVDPHYQYRSDRFIFALFLHLLFFSKHFLCHLWADFSETLPRGIASLAIKNLLFSVFQSAPNGLGAKPPFFLIYRNRASN